VTNEESTSTIKRSDIIVVRRTVECDFKKSTLHEIPTVINGLIVSKVKDNMLFSNPSTSRICLTSASKYENKDNKIIIIGDSHARGAVGMN
jgi:hypothetical protein